MSHVHIFIRVRLQNLAVLGLALSTICVTANAETAQFAYGVDAGDWSLAQYRVNPETGVLRHNGHLPAIQYPVALAVHPSKRFVITVKKVNNKVAVHRVEASSGRLVEIPESPFSVDTKSGGVHSPYSISIHPSGRFVYVSARWGGVVAFAMDEQSGVLTLVPGSPFAAQKRTRSVKVHPSGRFVYATNAHSNSISAYRVNEKTGALSPVQGSPFNTGTQRVADPKVFHLTDIPMESGGAPFRVEVHPSGRFIFVTNWMGLSFSVFKVNADSGALTPIADSPIQIGEGGLPYAVSVHPSGRFIYISSWYNNKLIGYRFNENSGHLTPLPDSPFSPYGHKPISIDFNVEGTRAYVTNGGSNSITQFSVDTKTGKFILEEVLRTRFQPFGVAMLNSEPVYIAQRFSFIVKDEKGQLKIIRTGSDGGAHTSNNKTSPGSATLAAVVGSRERFVYMAHNVIEKPEESGIAVYRINEVSGALKLLPEHLFRLGFAPTELAMDVSGRFLYAVNSSINSLGVFKVDSDSGALAPPKGQSPKTGIGPIAIALDPAGRFSFIANAKANTVSVFSHRRILSPAMYPINQEGSAFAVGKEPAALAVDPTGKFLMVANQGSNDLSVFVIHFHEGGLEAVKGSPFASGKAPVSVAIHPNGKLVYVLNSGSNDITSYRINSLNGELQALSNQVDAGSQPVTMTLDSEGRFAYVRNKGKNGFRKYTVDFVSGQLSYVGNVNVGSVVAIAD